MAGGAVSPLFCSGGTAGGLVFAAGRDFAGDHVRRFQAKDRTQPLAAREYAVAHGTVDGFRRPRRRRQQPLQRCIDRVLSRLKHLLNHKVVSITSAMIWQP